MICIVGHGPGTSKHQRGKEIDSHDVVVRFSDGLNKRDEDVFGIKTDYVLVNHQFLADLLNNNVIPKETWVYSRPGEANYDQVFSRIWSYNPYLCGRETDKWNKLFKELGGRGYCSERNSDPHLSQGMAAIIMCAERLCGEDIRLIGFDNLLAGDNGNYQAVTNSGTIKSGHDWEKEKELLDILISGYGTMLWT